MDLKNIVQLVGGYHHVEVSPDAHLDLGADVRLQVLKFQVVRI